MTVSLEGLHPTLMRPRVEAVLADPEAVHLGLYVVSAFRSIIRQQQLWNAALDKYKDPEVADNWVARPGTSNHGPKLEGYGTAVDFGLPNVKAVEGKWPPAVRSAVDAIAERHGLRSPMEWEDWHYEPIPWWTPSEPDAAPLTRYLEDDMPINAKTTVDKLDCPHGDGWYELDADGGVRTEGGCSHFYGSYFSLAEQDRNNPDRRFVAISHRRDRAEGYTIYANDGTEGYTFGPA